MLFAITRTITTKAAGFVASAYAGQKALELGHKLFPESVEETPNESTRDAVRGVLIGAGIFVGAVVISAYAANAAGTIVDAGWEALEKHLNSKDEDLEETEEE